MTYGVDQCRRCGKPIKVSSPRGLERYEKSLQRKRPTMSAKEWKAQGWKAAPTFWQLTHDLDGVCYDCKPKVVFRRPSLRLDVKLFWLLSFIGMVFGLVVFFGRHTS